MTHVLAQAGGGGGVAQYIQVAVWVLLLSLSFLGWLLRVIAQKRAESKVIQERKRREEEMLRTGRGMNEQGVDVQMAPSPAVQSPTSTVASADEAKRRLQELAQRRRAELQQMAERAQQGGGSAAPPVPSGGPAAGPRPGMSPAEQARRRAAQQQKAAKARAAEQARQHRERAAQTAQAQAQRARVEQEREARAQQERARREQVEREAAQREQMRRESAGASFDPVAAKKAERAGAAQAVPGRAGGQRAVVRISGRPSIEEIRHAFVMSEVLAPPLSERPPGEEDSMFAPPPIPVRKAG